MKTEDLTFEEKLNKLRKIHTYSDVDAKNQLKQWEDQMSRLRVVKEWLEHPNTIDLRNLAAAQLRNITAILSNDRDLPEVERKALFSAKEAHLAYLAALSQNPETEMETIENSLNYELET